MTTRFTSDHKCKDCTIDDIPALVLFCHQGMHVRGVFGQQSSPVAGAAQRAALAATRSTGNMPAVLGSLEDTGGMVLLLFTSS